MDSEKVLVRPEQPRSESIARISIEGELVRVYYPEKRDSFRRLAKRLGYVWKQPYWVKEVANTAAQPHRAAELARDLLAAQFCVKVERAIIDMVLAEAFAEEPRRTVKAISGGEYDGWFVLWWKRGENCYQAAKWLPGAKYHKPHVVVPSENFEEVLDFAQLHGFLVNQSALAIAEAARAEREAAIVVSVAARDTAVPAPIRGIPKLEVPEIVEIDDALVDEPL